MGSTYARPELLAEPEWVWEHRDDPRVRIVDCGPAEAHWRARVPGAVALPIHPWLKDASDDRYVIGPDAFADAMGALSVDGSTTVVAYDDDENAMLATRLWWVLAYYGHERAKVLNGGWRRWAHEGRPINFGAAPAPAPEAAPFTPRPNESLIARLDDVRAAVAAGDAQILDVRPRSWWEGADNPFGNKRVGHIPGAANIDSGALVLHEPPFTFKPSDELAKLLAEAGFSPKHEVIVHCQAGVRTTTGVLALNLIGWDRVRAFDAAMAEWANLDDTPLVVEEAARR